MKRLIASLVLVLSTLAGAGNTRAAATDLGASGRRAGATSLRVYGAIELFSSEELGLDFSRQLKPWLALDAMAAMVSIGRDRGALGRLQGRFITGDRHRLSIGLGPSVLTADHFGTVAFADLEVGYEFRATRGLSLIIAAGPSVALNDSGKGSCAYDRGGGWFRDGCWLDRESFSAGEGGGRVRVGLGASF